MRFSRTTDAGALVFSGLCLLVAAGRVPCVQAQTGLTPLMDFVGTYQTFEGGLYPGGVNTPPAAHLTAALQAAAEIVPRNAAGAPDPDGLIVLIAIGMSNTTHEFGIFERQEDANPTRNARLVLMDTALGGQTAAAIADPPAAYWTVLQQRLTAMGLTAAQVQVAWLKEADANPPNNFPVHAQLLRDELRSVANNLHDKFPSLKLCYLSSRTYGGYSPQGTLNPEPQAYESGFAAKWLIGDQIDGDSRLNYDPLAGPVRAPLLLWGPYLWADGTNPRSDGLTWQRADFETDAVHPSPSGEAKVANLLSDFFDGEATAAAWWPAQPGTSLLTLDAVHDAYVSAASPGSNFGTSTVLLSQGGGTTIRTYLRFDLSGITAPVRLAKLSLRVTTSGSGGGLVSLVNDTAWTEGTITWATAPALGATLVQMPQSSRDGTIAANVTETVRNDSDRQVAFALGIPAAQQAAYHSKEAGQPPRLVLVLETPPTDVTGRVPIRRSLELAEIRPNPFNPTATIDYTLPAAGRARLTVHDVRGRLIATLVDAPQEAGPHAATWDGHGRAAVSSGVLFVRLTFGDEVRTRKITVVR
jgi:hypothetical protein